MDPHLVIHFGGWDHFIGGEAVTKRLRTFNQRYTALKWQSWDSDPTLRDQWPKAALPSFTQGAGGGHPHTASLGRNKRFSLPSSNCLLVHVLPGEAVGGRDPGGLASVTQAWPGPAPPDWGCARGKVDGSHPARRALTGRGSHSPDLFGACM